MYNIRELFSNVIAFDDLIINLICLWKGATLLWIALEEDGIDAVVG